MTEVEEETLADSWNHGGGVSVADVFLLFFFSKRFARWVINHHSPLVIALFSPNPSLVGDLSNISLFSPLFGEDFQFHEYCSDGLKPPTSLVICKISNDPVELNINKYP